MRRLATFVLVGTVLFATTAIAQSATDANMEILVQKMKADKKLLVADNMDLTDAEAKSFWPMYDAYQKELGQVNRQLGRTIKQYAEAYNNGTVSNDLAKKLLGEALAIEEAEVNLKRSYAKKMGQVLPTTKVARYIQIENKIRAAVKAELAAQIPLVY